MTADRGFDSVDCGRNGIQRNSRRGMRQDIRQTPVPRILYTFSVASSDADAKTFPFPAAAPRGGPHSKRHRIRPARRKSTPFSQGEGAGEAAYPGPRAGPGTVRMGGARGVSAWGISGSARRAARGRRPGRTPGAGATSARWCAARRAPPSGGWRSARGCAGTGAGPFAAASWRARRLP